MSNDMHVWSIRWVMYLIFVCSHFDVFLTPRKGRPKPRKGLAIKLPHRNFEPLALPKRAHSDKKKRPKGGAFRVFERRKGPRAGRPPCSYGNRSWGFPSSLLSLTVESPSPPRPPLAIPEQERVELLSDANAEKGDLATLAQLTSPERRPPAPRDPFLAGQPQFLRGHSSSRAVLTCACPYESFFAGEPLVLRYSAT